MHVHTYLQRFDERLAINGKITTLLGYRSLMLSCADLLELRKSRLGPSKSMLNMLKIPYAACPCLSHFGAIRS